MWKKTTSRNFFLAAVVINIATIFSPIIFKNYLPPVIPLFYGRPSGEGQLTTSLGIILIPSFALIITVLNFFLSHWIHDVFLKKILAVSALAISILTIITVVKIILLVGFF